MKRETLKVIRAQARKQTLPPNKVKPSGKTYKRNAKHRARLEQNQHGPFSLTGQEVSSGALNGVQPQPIFSMVS